ncbi:MAG TPA: signal peptidase II [Kofleriaceae bacterium]|nr:signal peptidase II [Kofleriaceae bacterium]
MTEAPSPDRKKWLIFLSVAALSLVADQATKIWARGSLPVVSLRGGSCVVPDDIVARTCQGHPVQVIDGVWEWRLSMNPGSAFGLLSNQSFARTLFSVIGIIAVLGMLWMVRKARPDQKVLHWALALVAGGAIGNLIDRIYFGVVTDFILWRYRTHEWPVFNVADIVLVVGVLLMFIDIQKEGRREKALKAGRQKKAKAAGLIKDFGK